MIIPNQSGRDQAPEVERPPNPEMTLEKHPMEIIPEQGNSHNPLPSSVLPGSSSLDKGIVGDSEEVQGESSKNQLGE